MKRFPFEDAQPPASQQPAAPPLDQSPEQIAFTDAEPPLEPLPADGNKALDPLPAIQRILTHPQPIPPFTQQQRRNAELLPNIITEAPAQPDRPDALPRNDRAPEAKFEPFAANKPDQVGSVGAASQISAHLQPLPALSKPQTRAADLMPNIVNERVAQQDGPDAPPKRVVPPEAKFEPFAPASQSPYQPMPFRKSDPVLQSPHQPLPARKGAEPVNPRVLLSDAEQVPALPGIGQAAPAQRMPDPTQVPRLVQRRLDAPADTGVDIPPAPPSVAQVPPANTPRQLEPLGALQAEPGSPQPLPELEADVRPWRETVDADALIRELTPRRERSFLSFGSMLTLLSEEGA